MYPTKLWLFNYAYSLTIIYGLFNSSNWDDPECRPTWWSFCRLKRLQIVACVFRIFVHQQVDKNSTDKRVARSLGSLERLVSQCPWSKSGHTGSGRRTQLYIATYMYGTDWVEQWAATVLLCCWPVYTNRRDGYYCEVPAASRCDVMQVRFAAVQTRCACCVARGDYIQTLSTHFPCFYWSYTALGIYTWHFVD